MLCQATRHLQHMIFNYLNIIKYKAFPKHQAFVLAIILARNKDSLIDTRIWLDILTSSQGSLGPTVIVSMDYTLCCTEDSKRCPMNYRVEFNHGSNLKNVIKYQRDANSPPGGVFYNFSQKRRLRFQLNFPSGRDLLILMLYLQQSSLPTFPHAHSLGEAVLPGLINLWIFGSFPKASDHS